MSGYSRHSKIMKASTKMWIDGTTYNIRPKNKKKVEGTDPELNEQHKYYNISKDDDGKLSTSFRLPTAYCNKLNANPDFDIKHFQDSTKTELNLSKSGKTGKISIMGEIYENIAKAREEMHILLSQIREHYPAGQFISIPTLSEEVKENFKKFKEEVLTCGVEIPGMAESIFQKPEKLHLTIAIFALLDDFEKQEAVKALNTCRDEIIDKFMEDRTPVKIRVKGIDCMTPNLKKTSVLYANAKFADETDEFNLQKLANSISDYFHDKGLIKEYSGNVKLHVTLINTKYRNVERNSPNRSMQKRIPIDATYIMEKYKDYDFGETIFNSIHLSLISSKGDDGFYEPLSIIKI